MATGSSDRAVSMTCFSRGRPASGCNTLGSADFMRLPWPAARMTTEKGTARGTGACFLAICGEFSAPRKASAANDYRILMLLAHAVFQQHQPLADLGPDIELRAGVLEVLGAFAVLD